MADRELAGLRRLSAVANPIKAARIHIDGVVQGVGFRPFVFGLALEHGLTGWVQNTSAGVDIEIEGDEGALDRFISRLEPEAPPLAQIEQIEWDWIEANGRAEFLIEGSQANQGDFQPISADVAMCEDCQAELLDKSDRRYRYPFINCTNCGPRFTIIGGLPYDRPATTMANFELCPDCETEYRDPLDRRFHAQPIACPVCGPHVWLELADHRTAERDQAIERARQILQQGGVIGLKGLGGYQLACDACNEEAVQRLRQIKVRKEKPFALMVPDLAAAERLCQLTEAERQLLQSRQRPILLLAKTEHTSVAQSIAPGQATLGLMLPYTPLHHLLLQPGPNFPQALVMTSANRAGEPIHFENGTATAAFAKEVDGLLHHNRPIEQRCDDSVYRVFRGETYPIRRARGYAPFPVQLPRNFPMAYGAGAELKNTFCLTKKHYAFLSQHIGDLTNYETLQAYQQALDHFMDMFQIAPELVAYDLHPDYLSTQFAAKFSQANELPAYAIQHHQAHIGACLAEHQWPFNEPVIGLSFDGTGYGEDGAIWGGEVFTVDRGQFIRAFHLRYTPMPGGDQAVRQPWRLALAWLQTLGIDWEPWLPSVAAANTKQREIVQQQIVQGINAPLNSSVGRLFDAVASLMGVRQLVEYEAQAAMELETQVEPGERGAYPFDLQNSLLDPAPMFDQLIQDLKDGVSKPVIAARFHRGLAQACLTMTRSLRTEFGINTICLSGGVWQNMQLLRWTLELLEKDGFEILTHSQVPSNDGGLSLGQAWLAAHYFENGQPAPSSVQSVGL